MNALETLQLSFQNYLLSGNPAIENNIISTPNVSAIQRLAIYKNAYEARLIECLASNFPNLERYLGDEKFYELGLSYLNSYPSNFRSIRWFGESLPFFLSTYTDQPYLVELAEFEWKMTLTFDAADEHVLTIEEIALLSPDSWPTMILECHPSLQRFNFHWNTVELWKALDKQTTITPDKTESISSWVLWRENYINRFYSLAEEEKWALDTIIQGQTFADLCQVLCQWNAEEEVGLKAAMFLKKWIQMGLISKITVKKDI